MTFRVLKSFTWAKVDYVPGSEIDIPEGHPRLEAMLRGKNIKYDVTVASPIKVKLS
jgi:hypothetical protein